MEIVEDQLSTQVKVAPVSKGDSELDFEVDIFLCSSTDSKRDEIIYDFIVDVEVKTRVRWISGPGLSIDLRDFEELEKLSNQSKLL